MALSRKHRREQRRLRKNAQELLDEQRFVLGHAGDVLHEATSHAKSLGNTYVAPRVENAANQVRPYVERGVGSARRAADRVRLLTTPLVASALASTISTLDRLDNPDAAKQVRRFGERQGLIKSKKKRAGGIIAIGLGVAAAAGIGYAIWQAFRADDELWVAPEN
ncbi:DNA/RNA helicase [Leucobacter sp. GX24907]